MKIRVLDASAIIRSNHDYSLGDYLIPFSVYDEIKDETAKAALDDAVGKGLVKRQPVSPPILEKVKESASNTGDICTLSPQDLDVLALAYEMDGAVVSDDYAVQNTAQYIGLEVEATSADGIKEVILWRYKCMGCGKKYKTQTVCDICGHETRKVRS